MTRIYIIRHAEAEGNLYRRMHGQYDGLITENGYKQLDALKERFKDIRIDAVYSSDLARAKITASTLTQPRDMKLRTSKKLREINTGEWEDVPFGELEARYPNELKLFSSDPFSWRINSAETFSEVQARTVAFIKTIVKKHRGETVAIVTHGCALRAMLSGLLDISVCDTGHCDNTGVALLEFDEGKPQIAWLNDNSHLSDEISTFARQKWWKNEGKEPDQNLWFSPLGDRDDIYLEFHRKAWELILKDTTEYDGMVFLKNAKETTAGLPEAVVLAMMGNDIAGILQLDPTKDSYYGVGYISFVYLSEQYRNKGLGVQLIGHAVSFYRKRGRKVLRLKVAASNKAALKFYNKYGFRAIYEDRSSKQLHYVMEKNISQPRKK